MYMKSQIYHDKNFSKYFTIFEFNIHQKIMICDLPNLCNGRKNIKTRLTLNQGHAAIEVQFTIPVQEWLLDFFTFYK